MDVAALTELVGALQNVEISKVRVVSFLSAQQRLNHDWHV